MARVAGLDDEPVDGVAEVEARLHRGDAHLQDAAVEFRAAGVEQSIHARHQGRHPALAGGAEDDDLVADIDAEIGGQGGAQERAVGAGQVLARAQVVRQARQRPFAVAIDPDDERTEAAFPGGDQGEGLGSGRHGDDAGLVFEPLRQRRALGECVADLGVVEVLGVLHLQVAGHQAGGGLDPGVVGTRLHRHRDGHQEDREPHSSGRHPGAQPTAPQVAPGDADEHRPGVLGARILGARIAAGVGQRPPRSAKVVNRPSSTSASKSARR